MGCTDCTKAYKLIELPVGSSKDAVKSARKEWSKKLHPDLWQNQPGWMGAANKLTNINVAIDHLLQCDRAGSSSYASSRAKRKSVSEAEMPQVHRKAKEALRQAMEAARKANKAEAIEARHALKTRTKCWVMSAGFLVLFVLPLFLYVTTPFFSSEQADVSDQEPTSFILQPSGIAQSDASASSPTQPAPVVEERATLEKDVEQPEEVSINSSPASVSTAAPEAPASMASPPAVPEETQLKVEKFKKYCGVNPQEWDLSCRKLRSEVSVSFRPAYVPVKIKVMDHQVASDMAPTIRNQYGLAQRTAAVGYAAIQQPKAQLISRANILILSNGTTIYVTNVWYSGERIMFTMPNGSRLFLGLEQVNLRSTIQANHQVGVNFDPPRGYPSN
jgi:hypothetical protein